MGNSLSWFRWFNLHPPPPPPPPRREHSPSPPPKYLPTKIDEISDESDDYSSCGEECIEM